MTEREKTLTELGQMDEAAYRKWVAKKYGGKPTKEEMAEWLEWRREAVACLPEAKQAWAAERERLRVAGRTSRALTWEIVTSWPWRETGGLLFLVIFFVGLFVWISRQPVDDVTIPGVPVEIPGVPLGSPQEIARFTRELESLDSVLLGDEVMSHVVDECDFYLQHQGNMIDYDPIEAGEMRLQIHLSRPV